VTGAAGALVLQLPRDAAAVVTDAGVAISRERHPS